MKIVSFYDVAPGALARIKEFYPAHRARLEEFHARGVLIAAGPLGNPPESAMGIFTSREAAAEFIEGDPFVTNGLISKWRLLEWNDAFM
ncbi:MAG TPA: YciI family protein [Gammaproteobacteria bacterium]|nr:YciI family protein [Gammaproteobacteria bacterium]